MRVEIRLKRLASMPPTLRRREQIGLMIKLVRLVARPKIPHRSLSIPAGKLLIRQVTKLVRQVTQPRRLVSKRPNLLVIPQIRLAIKLVS